jgi:hypothetical protein
MAGHQVTTPTTDDILELARMAIDSYFRGEFASKRSIRFDMEALRGALRDYDAKQITTKITREPK